MSKKPLSHTDALVSELEKLDKAHLVKKLVYQEQKLAKLNDSENHFHNLFENAPVPILEIDYSKVKQQLDALIEKGIALEQYFEEHPNELLPIMGRRIIKEVNKSAIHFLRAKSAEHLRENLDDIYNPLGALKMPAIIQAFMNGQKYLKVESSITDFMGEQHNIVMRISTTAKDFSRTFMSFEDISEIKKIQEELETRVKTRTYELEKANRELRAEIKSREQIAKDLRHSEARYRQLNAIYPVGIFHTDKNGKNTYVNSKACEIQGMKASDARAYGWTETLHPEDRERVISTWENGVKYGIPINIDYRFVRNNKVTWVNGQTVPEYDEKGSIAGYVGILADITRQREAEEQIKQNQIEIAHFSRLNSMGEVASGIAHELNQPLTAIMSYASGVKRRLKDIDKNISKEIFDAIDQTIAQAQRAGEVIHHLKDFLRKGALSKKQTDINAAINDVLMFISTPISNANISINLKLDKQLPSIYADKIHIEQVVINIINNAVDAIVEAESTKREITISTASYEKDSIRITIADTGPGIASSLIDNIFNPFITTKQDGMGIGLSLCYNIVDKHGGKITVSSKQDKGTIFHIILPIR